MIIVVTNIELYVLSYNIIVAGRCDDLPYLPLGDCTVTCTKWSSLLTIRHRVTWPVTHVMATEADEGIVTSRMTSNDSITSATSVFDRYSWVGLLAVHGPTALRVSQTAACIVSCADVRIGGWITHDTSFVRPSVCFLSVFIPKRRILASLHRVKGGPCTKTRFKVKKSKIKVTRYLNAGR